MTTEKHLSSEEIVKSFENEFKNNITDIRVEKRTQGVKKTEFMHIWMRVGNNVFKEAVRHLAKLDPYTHFAVSSGYDAGNTIDLVYHFSIYHGTRHKEISVNFTVSLPKSNPIIETITDIFPGAIISEQEKQEMLGVKIRGIPKDTRVFISDDFPKDMYPWRRDETGPQKMVRNLHKEAKQ